MNSIRLIFQFMIVVAVAADSHADFLAGPVMNPTSHPVAGAAHRSPSIWRQGVGAFGESIVDGQLRMRGFTEVVEVKNPVGHGIDRVAVKRSTAGEITDVRFVEVKTHRAAGPARLGRTVYGEQLSPKWLAEKLRQMRQSGNAETRSLARDIGRFRRQSGRPIISFGEVHDINLRSGMYVVRNQQGALIMQSETDRLLRDIQRHQRMPPVYADWATRHLAQWDQIKQTSMSKWLGRDAARTRSVVAASRVKPTRTAQARVPLRRFAGPLSLAIAVAVDLNEWRDLERSYSEGRITHRDRFVDRAGIGGGAAGAFAGGAIGVLPGAKVGASIGALGGPLAWVTVPVGGVIGGIVGGAVGGMTGYLGGRAAATWAADAWYERIDQRINDHVDQWMLVTSSPP